MCRGILFFAGLRPNHRARDLDEDELALLAKEMRGVTRRSYRTGGVTELPEIVKVSKASGEKRRSFRHAVFTRGGKPCRRCKNEIEKHTVAGRQLYLCPFCQI
ncbi:MAG: zinc finger domain-containing protein [Planctomycetota bacterium]